MTFMPQSGDELTVPVLGWAQCYAEPWVSGTDLVAAAFQHPAKCSKALLRRILEHGLQRGYFQRGDLIADPFGGVATTAILATYYGLRAVSVELEPRFCELAGQNLELHRRKWETLGVESPTLICGDSREFAALIQGAQGIVTSPPYADSINQVPGTDVSRAERQQDLKNPWGTVAAGTSTRDRYGTTPGQIGTLPAGDLSAVISSPPYAEGCAHTGGTDLHPEHVQGGEVRHVDYGTTPGQIGTLPAGDLSAVLTSPPYAGAGDVLGTQNNIDYSKVKHGSRRATPARVASGENYGESPGQIGALPTGTLAATITSPPYAANEKSDYLLSADGMTRARDERRGYPQGKGCFRGSETYGETPGQIGRLRAGEGVDAVCTSPPYADSVNSQTDGIDWARMEGGKRNRTLEANYQTHGSGIVQQTYGETDGQIGREHTESYWNAMSLVWQQVHHALKPGGVLCVVVKSYVRDGTIIDLPEQTWQLLQSVGFVPLERCRAWLVEETRTQGLWGEEVTEKRKESFFRRLHRKKFPHLAIEFESVLWLRRGT